MKIQSSIDDNNINIIVCNVAIPTLRQKFKERIFKKISIDMLDNIMIRDTTQHLQLMQVQSSLTPAQTRIANLGATLTLTSSGTLKL